MKSAALSGVLCATLMVGTASAQPPPDVIFADGFEGDLSAWSASATDGGDLHVTTTAALAATYQGLGGTVDDTAGLYAQDDNPRNEDRYRARFYVDPNGFDPGEASGHRRTRVFIAFEEAPTRRLLAVVLRRLNGQYALMGRARLDDNSQADTAFFSITDEPHVVEVDWRRASGPDAADGTFELWIDGVSRQTLTGLDNHLSSVDFVRLGALSVKVGATGTIHWDEFESRRDTYIGPCPGDVCPLICPDGTGDCDGTVSNGCERSLRTLADCGACGTACLVPNGTCSSGTCQACPSGTAECDGDPDTVCETAVDTVANCGGCGVTCTNEHGTSACAGGTCQPSCDPLWGTCDGDPRNGCERPLNTLSDCGDCDATCDLANASESCDGGTCTLGACSVGFDNCDAVTSNGCEQALDTLSHCGQCGQACDLPNASESCSTGTCTVGSCDAGFANCDGSQANGCEVVLSGHSNASPGDNLGTYDADSSTGFLCPGQGCDFLLTRTGRRGQFFQITAHEGSSCCAYVGLRFELIVPAGVDYDLYVNGAPICDPFACNSRRGTGLSETIDAWRGDDCAAVDDSFTAVVEVRYVGGSSCQAWTLNVYRREC